MNICRLFLLLFIGSAMVGCTTVTIDQIRLDNTQIDPSKDTIVVLGRHHSSEYETEPSLVSCVGRKLKSNIGGGLNVIDETEFQNALYPWFEPRTAPLNLEKFIQILDQPYVEDALKQRNVKYMIWIEGGTEQTSSGGTLSCTILPGAAGCFGFGVWEDQSNYEASIWDFQETNEVGRISTDAQGTSYLPAIFIPVPLLARVQANACDGMGDQIADFLQSSEEAS